jgi:heptose I phosphotransferase
VVEAYLRDDLAPYFADDPLSRAWAMEGEIVRDVAGRQTLRVELGGGAYYLKRHQGVGVAEILKNWLVGKRPILGARNEYEACRHLEARGLIAPRVAAYAEDDAPAPARASFVLTDELTGYEDLKVKTLRWLDAAPTPLEKRRLLMRVADFARRFHDAGLVHRDFYLCHLLEHPDPALELGVLDLHRALIFDEIPAHWRLKDLAALLYSSLDLPVNRLSWLRFVRVYTGRPLQQVFAEEGVFWQAVYARALKLYRKGERKSLTRGNFQS